MRWIGTGSVLDLCSRQTSCDPVVEGERRAPRVVPAPAGVDPDRVKKRSSARAEKPYPLLKNPGGGAPGLGSSTTVAHTGRREPQNFPSK